VERGVIGFISDLILGTGLAVISQVTLIAFSLCRNCNHFWVGRPERFRDLIIALFVTGLAGEWIAKALAWPILSTLVWIFVATFFSLNAPRSLAKGLEFFKYYQNGQGPRYLNLSWGCFALGLIPISFDLWVLWKIFGNS
jgi:hypothetical protein